MLVAAVAVVEAAVEVAWVYPRALQLEHLDPLVASVGNLAELESNGKRASAILCCF